MDKKIKQYYVQRKPVSDAESENEIEEEAPQPEIKNKKTRKASTHSVAESEKSVKKNTHKNGEKNGVEENQHQEQTSSWIKNKFAAPQKLENIGKDDNKNQKPAKKVKAAMIPHEASSEESEDRPIHSDEESD